MIVIPKSGPHATTPSNPIAAAATGPSGREKAIAAIEALRRGSTQENVQEHPVMNASIVSPEEMSAIKPSSSSESVEMRQIDNSESPVATETTEATKAKEDPISTQYAILARKEKAIRARVQELKAKEDAMRAQELAAKSKSLETPARLDESADLRARLAKDPMSVLNELGITYDQLTTSAASQPSFEELKFQKLESELKAEIKALRDAQEGTKKTFEERDKQSYDQAISQIRNEAHSLVMSNPDFETIKETGSLNDVVELIKLTFEKDGRLLTVEEAAREVEDHLVEEVMKTTRIKKIQQRLQPVAKAPEAAQSPNQAPKSQTMKTLTNAVASSRPLTAKERAVLAFRGELK